jgi:hypothetical protein
MLHTTLKAAEKWRGHRCGTGACPPIFKEWQTNSYRAARRHSELIVESSWHEAQSLNK